MLGVGVLRRGNTWECIAVVGGAGGREKWPVREKREKWIVRSWYMCSYGQYKQEHATCDAVVCGYMCMCVYSMRA